LLLLGALEGKVVVGSMNRGGLAGSRFEVDDRFTALDPPGLANSNFNGGKMLVRIVMEDAATAATLERCGRAVSELASLHLMAMVEPFIANWRDGRLHNELTPEATIRAISIGSGLGNTSAHTWLKVPVVPDMERVMNSSSLPALILGGEVPDDPESAYLSWQKALRLPTVRGLVIGRSLLYPADGDVGAAVDTAVGLL
jgi:hypothetical protein